MNGTEAAYSYTLKTPAGNLVTIRGDDYDEFFNNLTYLATDKTEFVKTLAELQAAIGHVEAGSVDRSTPRRSTPPSRTNREPSQPDDDGNNCKHGPMEYRDFTSKAGNHVKGYFCVDNDKMCKPVWAK